MGRDISPVMVNQTRRADPAMLGQSRYPRTALDHYPTQPPAIRALLPVPVVQNLIHKAVVWEPCCGDGAIVKEIASHCLGTVSTDIAAYEGFDPDALVDLLALPDLATLTKRTGDGRLPSGIITNPPYGDLAQPIIEKSLDLMKDRKGFVMMLLRHDWDCASGRHHLFDEHPAFAAKITLTFRPLWIKPAEGEKSGSPRFSYAWFVWDWAKDPATPAQQLYARRPK